jgi:hypothetical protein
MDGSHFPPEKTMPEFSEYGSEYDDPALKNTLEYWLRKQPATDPEAHRGHLTGGVTMDSSSLPSDMRYVLLNKEFADLIDDMDQEDLKFLLEIIRENKDCVCGCRGLSHIAITTDDQRLGRGVIRFREQPAVPDFEEQFRV